MTHAAENPATIAPDSRVAPTAILIGKCHLVGPDSRIGGRSIVKGARIVHSRIHDTTVGEGADLHSCQLAGINSETNTPEGCVIIGKRSRLYQSILGPRTSVGDGTELSFVRAVSAVHIGNGVKIGTPKMPEPTTLGEGTLIADDVYLESGRNIGPNRLVLPIEEQTRLDRFVRWLSRREITIRFLPSSDYSLVVEYGDKRPALNNHNANSITLAERMA